MRNLAFALALATALLLAACGPASEPVVVEPRPPASGESTAAPGALPLDDVEIALEPVAEGFEQPLFVTGAGDGSGRLFVVEKTGRIWTVRDGERSSAPWLDLSQRVSTESERGLLGLAFAPDFERSGVFYIDYTDRDGNTVVARLTAEDPAGDGDVDLASQQVVITAEQPYSNHNGGMVAFGPDGYLYVGLGDGGSGGDPDGNGQDTTTLLGSVLRLDVAPLSEDAAYPQVPYVVPADNPFVDIVATTADAPRAEIWAWGLRNPWRFSFDRQTGDLWIGDVGQNAWEEIDFVPRSDVPGDGHNFGWNRYEGSHPFPPGSEAAEGDFAAPLVEYDRSAGRSVTGGYVYRGSDFRELAGTYFYGDFETGRLWGLQLAEDTARTRLLLETGMALVSFGEDDDGELYVVDFGGGVYRVTAP